MYHLQVDLEKLKLKIEKTELFNSRIIDELFELVASYRRDVTLYYERSGICIEACQGDASISSRHLRHKETNRLSGIRAI